MKKMIIILFLCIAGLLKAQQEKTTLIIKAEPAGSAIIVNGKLEGRGKVEIGLIPGIYTIFIKESLFKWTGGEVSDTIVISGNEKKIEKYYRINPSNYITSIPADAKVTLNDSFLGYTPLFVESAQGRYSLIKDNYLPKEIILNSGVNEVSLGEPVNGKQSSFTKSPWFKVLLGTAAVLGAAAAYYKIKADKSYDTYLNNMSPSTLDEVNRYDTVSGIALGALQINFGLLLYLLLTE